MRDISWAPIIPLIGGFALGAEKVLGTKPKFVGSYLGFGQNDALYVDHLRKNGYDGEYRNMIDDQREEHVDIVVCTPPCAALSRLNTGKSEDVAGATCPKNEWMYQCLDDAIRILTANVVIIENAPNLYTSAGKPIRDNLIAICESYGYSCSFYKTNTEYHGIPQNRDRTFFFAWKSKTAPVLRWFDRPRKSLPDFLSDIPEDSIHQDEILTPEILKKDGHYNYIKEKYGDVRKVLKEDDLYSCFKFIMYRGEFDNYLEWCRIQNVDRWLRLAEHRKMKTEKNQDAWDSSIRVYHDVFGAVVMRNMSDAMHPVHERSLTLREAMRLMGMPEDFVIPNGKAGLQKLTQNVPVATAADMVGEAVRFMEGRLEDSGNEVMMQNNNYETNDVEIKTSDLSSLF